MYAKANEPVLAELVERPRSNSGLPVVLGLLGAAAFVLLLFVLFAGLVVTAAVLASRPALPPVAEAGGVVLQVTDETFDAEVLNAGTSDPILVDFYADWCSPCRTQARVLQRFAATAENVKVVKVDVDESTKLSLRYDIESIPTLLVVKNGKVTARHEGLANERELARLIQK